MATRILQGRVFSGAGDAENWPTEHIRTVTGYPCLKPGTLNVRLGEPHVLRHDFTLPREDRPDRQQRPENLYFESCWLLIGTDRVRALIARTSTNFHGCEVLEIMAEEKLKQHYGLQDSDCVSVEVRVDDGEPQANSSAKSHT